ATNALPPFGRPPARRPASRVRCGCATGQADARIRHGRGPGPRARGRPARDQGRKGCSGRDPRHRPRPAV
ncbi:MAG: hypothetical protein AVDCRST_MAG68-3377, partial [uncultured Gemmatimonadetes bacterium]